MVHIYTGDGKGKTTAAVGLAVRAAGAGFSVLFAQFLKDGTSCEIDSLEKLSVSVIKGFTIEGFIDMKDKKAVASAQKTQSELLENICNKTSRYDMIILDECGAALSLGLIKKDRVLDFIKSNSGKEIILTGHSFGEDLLKAADYISKISCVKHPYNSGVKARRGIEF